MAHVVTSYADIDQKTFLNGNFTIPVFLKIQWDEKEKEADSRNPIGESIDGVIQVDVSMNYNGYHQLTEEEVLALSELFAIQSTIGGQFINAFKVRNGITTSKLEIRCSQDLARAYIQDELMGTIQEFSQRFQILASLSIIQLVFTYAVQATESDLQWYKDFKVSGNQPDIIYPIDENAIFERVTASKLGEVFLPTRRALMEFANLPHNIERGYLQGRPLQSVLGTIRHEKLKQDDGSGRFKGTYIDNGTEYSTYINHITRVSLSCIRKEVFGQSCLVIIDVQPHYNRKTFLQYQERGLTLEKRRALGNSLYKELKAQANK
ncbi:hypothetical protein [Vibrio crassostreae]|uniref:hypothetical protein n=1 Tax=Vibrio crassostreae TaxID=246167 RepID=UPI001B3149AE|nr:hypothetical protein [Vibrio crassostreae]